MLFDLKSIILGSALGICVGGGIYGMYVKTFAKADLHQVLAYQDLGECTTLLNTYDSNKIEDFLKKYSEREENISKSDNVASTITSIATGQVSTAGMGAPLKLCVGELTKRLDELENS